MTLPVSLQVFATATTDDRCDVAVDLPLAWARPTGAVRVALHQQGILGWHAVVRDGDEQVLDFAWNDDVDRTLLGDATGGDLPTQAPTDRWDDMDECWWASIHRVGADLYVAESDYSELVDLLERGPVEPRLVRPGLVEVGGVEVLWHRVRADDWDAAWLVAREFFAAASAPTRVDQGLSAADIARLATEAP